MLRSREAEKDIRVTRSTGVVVDFEWIGGVVRMGTVVVLECFWG